MTKLKFEKELKFPKYQSLIRGGKYSILKVGNMRYRVVSGPEYDGNKVRKQGKETIYYVALDKKKASQAGFQNVAFVSVVGATRRRVAMGMMEAKAKLMARKVKRK